MWVNRYRDCGLHPRSGPSASIKLSHDSVPIGRRSHDREENEQYMLDLRNSGRALLVELPEGGTHQMPYMRRIFDVGTVGGAYARASHKHSNELHCIGRYT